MKPVVSSIVALAIAIAPLSAFAAETHAKPASAKVVKHKKGERIAKADKSSDKSDKAEKSSDKADKSSDKVVAKAEKAERSEKEDKPSVMRVHHLTKDKPVHHAHGVEVGGAGHKEPKMVDHGGALIPASLMTKSHVKVEKVSTKEVKETKEITTRDLPKLPNPNASKATSGKSGAEKGARKPAEKKTESADSSDDGQTERDEDFAELVARIRGSKHVTGARASSDDDKSESKARSVDEPAPQSKLKRASAKTACVKDPVEVIRGPEIETFELTKCDGSIAPLAIEHLSILVRPGSAARPTTPLAELAKVKGPDLAHGIRRIDERLAHRLQAIVDHFAKVTGPAKLSVVSGYRPTSVGSMHATGRAIDFRLEGAKNEDVVAFCKTLSDTGCGYYPNSSFVHVDVRDTGAGHVTWIDASGPGETPRYVSAWPPPAPKHTDLENTTVKEPATAIDRELASEPIDEHPATP